MNAHNYTWDLGKTFSPEENFRYIDTWRLIRAMTQVQLPVTKMM
jgi:hypothetical protein